MIFINALPCENPCKTNVIFYTAFLVQTQLINRGHVVWYGVLALGPLEPPIMDESDAGDDAGDWLRELLEYNREALGPHVFLYIYKMTICVVCPLLFGIMHVHVLSFNKSHTHVHGHSNIDLWPGKSAYLSKDSSW